MGQHHYLGAGQAVGDYLAPNRGGGWPPGGAAGVGAGLLRAQGSGLVDFLERAPTGDPAQTHRPEPPFPLIDGEGAAPNLASQALGAALRALPQQWQERFGYRPLLAESFTDPEAYAGTCYKATNWEPVGMSAGYSRHRADFYVFNDRPKRLWLRELAPGARAQLRAVDVPEDCRGGLLPCGSGVLPVKQEQMDSLCEVFRKAPDPRDSNTQYRTGPVLTLIAMALLAGRREIAEIARFATTLTHPQRRRLGLPLKKGTRGFYKVPGYDVFYQVLTRMDPEAFAGILNDWLASRAGSLPQALALDGKMIRDHIGLLTLAQHEDGAPQASPFTTRKRERSAASRRRRWTCWKNSPLWTARSSPPIPSTAREKRPASLWKKAATSSSRSKATNPNCSSKPKAWTLSKTPPFCPHPVGTRTDRNPPTPCLPHRAHDGRLPLCPNPDRPAQRAHRQKERQRPPPNPATTFPALCPANIVPPNGWNSFAVTGAEWKSATTGDAMPSWEKTAPAAASPICWPIWL
jgi:hypothetical protein